MVNFGVVKNQVAQRVGQLRLRGDKTGAEALCQDFLSTVKQSPVLMLEYVTFRNLEKNSGFPTTQAYQYIDDHVRLLGRYDRVDIMRENAKLGRFLGENYLPPQELLLTESIQTLILETASRQNGAIPDVDALHQALHTVAEHVSQEPAGPSPIQEEIQLTELPKGVTFEQVFALAYGNLVERVQQLPDKHRLIVETVLRGTEAEKTVLFEEMCREVATQLDAMQLDVDLLREAKQELNSMMYNPATLADDIVRLTDLIA